MPAFALTAQNGNAFSSDSLKGKVWVADFIFTTCSGPCPRMSAQMRRLQERLLRNSETLNSVRLLSISVDPVYDTPETLLEHSGAFLCDYPWKLLEFYRLEESIRRSAWGLSMSTLRRNNWITPPGSSS